MNEAQEKKLKEMLTKLAKRKCWFENEDFSACDYSGGNFDDAYGGGVDDGEASLAKEILSEFFS